MFKKLTFALVSVLMLGTASAAMAQSSAPPSKDHQTYVCQTDDGYGRTLPCDMGGGN